MLLRIALLGEKYENIILIKIGTIIGMSKELIGNY